MVCAASVRCIVVVVVVVEVVVVIIVVVVVVVVEVVVIMHYNACHEMDHIGGASPPVSPSAHPTNTYSWIGIIYIHTNTYSY